jgi:hypothetical protein
VKEETPVALIGLNDAEAVSNILTFYECYLLATCASSAKRKRQLADVQGLLAKVLLPDTAKAAVLTHEEVACMNSAMNVFIAQVRAKIPASINRDAVIESCEQLRAYIATTFASKKGIHD